jgi:hypothetical protein
MNHLIPFSTAPGAPALVAAAGARASYRFNRCDFRARFCKVMTTAFLRLA